MCDPQHVPRVVELGALSRRLLRYRPTRPDYALQSQAPTRCWTVFSNTRVCMDAHGFLHGVHLNFCRFQIQQKKFLIKVWHNTILSNG